MRNNKKKVSTRSENGTHNEAVSVATNLPQNINTEIQEKIKPFLHIQLLKTLKCDNDLGVAT